MNSLQIASNRDTWGKTSGVPGTRPALKATGLKAAVRAHSRALVQHEKKLEFHSTTREVAVMKYDENEGVGSKNP